MSDQEVDPFAEHRGLQKLSKLEVAIRFADVADFDFKAGGEASGPHGLTAHNVANASRFEIKSGGLVIEVPSPEELMGTGRTAEWSNRARSAPYLELTPRYTPPEQVWGGKYHQVQCMLTVKDQCDEAVIIFADALGNPSDGNSQVFTTSRWSRPEAAATTASISSVYAAQRQVMVADTQEIFGAQGGSNPPFSRICASIAGGIVSLSVTRVGKHDVELSDSVGELSCFREYGVNRDHYLRICVGAQRSANSQRASLELSEINVIGIWNPPWLQG